MPRTRSVAWLLRGFDLIGRFAPSGHPFVADARETFAAICQQASAEGPWRLIRRGLREWFDLAWQVIRLRVGRRAPISIDRATRQPDGFKARAPLGTRLRAVRRSLAAAPAVTLMAVGTLAMGIGLATAVFSILDSILWHPVPYRGADRLVELASFNAPQKIIFNGGFSLPLIRQWRSERDVFDRIEAYDTSSFIFANDRGADMVPGARVSAGLLAMLGVPAEYGRVFTEADGRPGTDHVAIVSERFWRSALGRDPRLGGLSISIDADTYAVLGVMPASFRFPNEDVDVWLPLNLDDPPPTQAARTLTPLARLVPGLSAARADERVRADGARLAAAVAGANSASAGPGPGTVSAALASFGRYVDDKTERSLWVLAAAVAFLLLVVCANVANLSLARALSRTRDLAVRSALGASRRDLVGEALVESAAVAAAASAAGIAIAAGLIHAAVAVLPEAMTSSTVNAIDLDGRALACAIGLSVFAGLSFALPSAIVSSRRSIASLLGTSSRGASTSAAARRLRSALVIAEVTVSIVLLVGAALMTRSFVKLETAGKGFDPDGLLSVRVALPSAGYQAVDARNRFVTDAMGRIGTLPGVTAVTTGGLPVWGESGLVAIGRAEFASRPGTRTERLFAPMFEVPAGYFSALRLPIVQGRTFDPSDLTGSVIVNESFARKYFPPGAAIGGRFRIENGVWQTVVGVAGDTRGLSADQPGRAQQFYYPIGQAPDAFRPIGRASSIADQRTLLIRATRPATVVPLVAAAIHALDPHVVIWKTTLVEHQYAQAIARPRVVLLMMSVFAVVGLLLALAGIYGVLSQLVSQRLREIGIRLALGAQPGDVGRLVMSSGLLLTVIGLVAGLALALGLSRVMRSLLYEVGPSDPLSLSIVALLLLATAGAAAWRPARRAMRVDPLRLLRED